MLRKDSEAVPEGNGPVPRQEEFESDQPTLADVYRLFEESFDIRLKIIKSRFGHQEKKLNEFMEMRATEQRSGSLEQDARLPCLAMEEDVPSDTKTCERKEGAATAVQAKHGDNCSANQVDPDPMCLASFGDDSTGPPALPCLRDDALVDNGAAALESCFSPLEIRTPTAAGVLLPADTASTATRTTFDQPPLWFCPTEEINLRTSDQYAMDYSSFWKIKVL